MRALFFVVIAAVACASGAHPGLGTTPDDLLARNAKLRTDRRYQELVARLSTPKQPKA